MWAVLFTGICFFESEPPPVHESPQPQACENANDPRCAVQPAAPASPLAKLKHAPEVAWVAAVPAYSKAAYVLISTYAGKALAGFKPRPVRPPRHA